MPAKGRILRWLHGAQELPWGMAPEDYNPGKVSDTLVHVKRLFGPGRYFDVEVRGWEHMPSSPVLVVSNHSGGTMIPDAWGFISSWYTLHGVQRPIHPLAHELILSNRFTGSFFAERGVLRGSRDVALKALKEWGRDLMVMPGGDLDTWRPYTKRYEVCFGGRKGYAALAMAAGVPIVPIANAGAHETLRVLTDGQKLAKALRIKQLARANIFPIHLSLPWGLAVGPWPHLPPPTKLRYRIGPPIPPPSEARPGQKPSSALIERFDNQVRGAVQSLLDALKRDEARASC